MNQQQQQVLNEINSFVKSNGGSLSNFYVGVTDNPMTILREHGVKLHKEGDSIISENTVAGAWPLAYEAEARELKAFLIGQGMTGRMGGARAVSTNVYCYKITPETKQ
ncbi:MAG: hypothetical protein PHD21_06255 [Flavobacteriales bacterium]|nr:hypothetical protein [Flavobacteriales bacterium]